MGYGAMQLAGPGVWGPPRDRGGAIAVLRKAVERRIRHIDTSDYYGPHIVNEMIRDGGPVGLEYLNPKDDSFSAFSYQPGGDIPGWNVSRRSSPLFSPAAGASL